ncbi:MAG: DUF3341 domain-containing protein [Bryobacterales bacterium]|nr:DUF3341 domain-containing protein [Bryobacterales bacterium]
MATSTTDTQDMAPGSVHGKPYAVATTFDTSHELLSAIRGIRKKGYRKLDAYTPFPIHGIDEALGERRSKLGFVIGGGALAGILTALGLQWWTAAVDYPIIIGGKPFFAIEYAVPITFELMVLFASFAAVFGMLAFNGLPRFNHPIFNYENYARVTDDGFVLVVERDGNHFEPVAIVELLNELGGKNTEVVHEDA